MKSDLIHTFPRSHETENPGTCIRCGASIRQGNWAYFVESEKCCRACAMKEAMRREATLWESTTCYVCKGAGFLPYAVPSGSRTGTICGCFGAGVRLTIRGYRACLAFREQEARTGFPPEGYEERLRLAVSRQDLDWTTDGTPRKLLLEAAILP